MSEGTLNIAGARLKSFIERVERLDEERKNTVADIKEVFSEAKGAGFDVPTLKRIIKERSQSASDRAEKEALYQMYAHGLGMTPMEAYIAENKPALKAVG